MKKVFEVERGYELRAKASKVGRVNSTMFEGYLSAFEALKGIVNATERYSQKQLRDDSLYNYDNNLIAFTARRGYGKTSAMLTFSGALENPAENITIDTSTDMGARMDQNAKWLMNYRFVVLPPIDPTLLDAHHDILTTLLSKILKLVTNVWKGNNGAFLNQYSTIQKNTLLEQINRCYQSVNELLHGSTGSEGWTLEKLMQLGDATNLRSELYQMILTLMSFLGCPQNGFLVVQIDDADMNFRQIYNIMEYTRQYLMIPRVVILFAIDTDTVFSILTKRFYLDLSPSCSDAAWQESALRNACKMAEQYILKVFPSSHQIELPKIGELIQNCEDDFMIRYSASGALQKVEAESYQWWILKEIYRKTGILFIKSNTISPILPNTQRGIISLLTLLDSMPEVKHLDQMALRLFNSDSLDQPQLSKCDCFFYHSSENGTSACQHRDELVIRERNVGLFASYFVNEWIRTNIPSKDEREFLFRLHDAPITQKNAIVIDYLEQILLKADPNATSPGESTATYNPLKSHEISYVRAMCLAQDAEKISNKATLVFGIHVLYMLASHCIVLNRLISHYSGGAGSSAKACTSFEPLEGLYGNSVEIAGFQKPSGSEILDPNQVFSLSFKLRSRWFSKKVAREQGENDVHLSCRYYYSHLFGCQDNTANATQDQDKCLLAISAPFFNSLYHCKPSDFFIDTDVTFSLQGSYDSDYFYLQDMSLQVVLTWDWQKHFIELVQQESKTPSLSDQEAQAPLHSLYLTYAQKMLSANQKNPKQQSTVTVDKAPSFEVDKHTDSKTPDEPCVEQLIGWFIPLETTLGLESGAQQPACDQQGDEPSSDESSEQ